MIKFLWIFLGLLLISLASIYITLPARIIFSSIVYLNSGKSSAQRYVADNNSWHYWWPGSSGQKTAGRNNTSYIYKGYRYLVENKSYSGMEISVSNENRRVNTLLHLVQLNADSVAVEWKGEMPATNNPLQRLFHYRAAHSLKRNMAEILEHVKSFLNEDEKIYGLKILHEMVKDTVLISTRMLTKTYPETEVIYGMIHQLENYVKSKKGGITNYPMLHVSEDSGGFVTMVALPLDKEIAENKKFRTKRMVAGKILAAEIKGGNYTSKEGIKKLEMYMEDYQLKSPAIFFESLITNRVKEPDTLKWLTKIYYPVY